MKVAVVIVSFHSNKPLTETDMKVTIKIMMATKPLRIKYPLF